MEIDRLVHVFLPLGYIFAQLLETAEGGRSVMEKRRFMLIDNGSEYVVCFVVMHKSSGLAWRSKSFLSLYPED